MKFSSRLTGERSKQPGRHFILRGRGIASRKLARGSVMINDRHGEIDELRMAAAEILLTVVGTGTRGLITGRTCSAGCQLRFLAGPAARRAFHPVVDSGDQFGKRHFQRNCRIDFQILRRQPFIQKNRLWQTAGKSIEHPSPGLARQPIREDRAHQVIRQVFTAGEDGLRLFSQLRPGPDVFPEQCPGAEITEPEAGRQPPSLSPLAGSRRPEQDDAERLGGWSDQRPPL